MIVMIEPGKRIRRTLEFTKGNRGAVLGILNDSSASWSVLDENHFESPNCSEKEWTKILVELSRSGEFNLKQTVERY